MGLWHSFREGGWAMYLIFAFGLLGVGAAGRFAWRGEHQLVGFVRWITLTVLACGAFGFFVGIQRLLGFAGERLPTAPFWPELSLSDRRATLLIEGTREALTCVSGALMFVVVICLLAAIGERRFPLPNPAAVPR
jgi:hypothetical protein